MAFRDIGCEFESWMELVQDLIESRGFVSAMLSLWVLLPVR
jgi:hypothetical protein